MRKNNKGIALAYTLMVMLLVFAICAVITSITLSQIAATDRYAASAETERIYLEIGELFCSVDGDEDSFKSALGNDVDDTSDEGWVVTRDNHQFLLVCSTESETNKLVIQNAAGTKIYLTVGVKSGQIVEWTKGTD